MSRGLQDPLGGDEFVLQKHSALQSGHKQGALQTKNRYMQKRYFLKLKGVHGHFRYSTERTLTIS